MQTNSSTASITASPGNVVSRGYTGHSFTVKTTVVFFCALAIYNALELILLIFFTFSSFGGLYFYSLLVSSLSLIPYASGFILQHLVFPTGHMRWLAITLNTTGWYGIINGQSIVLWSRLHLLVDKSTKGQRILRWTKWLIIADAVVLQIPTTALSYGSNGPLSTRAFQQGYNIMEKIQMSGFVLQEIILSSLYIMQAATLLKDSMRHDAKNFFAQLLGINVIIIAMDLGLLGTEAASLYLYETVIKGVIYSIKLKLEFAVLGKLVYFVEGGPDGDANEQRMSQACVTDMGPHTPCAALTPELGGSLSIGRNDSMAASLGPELLYAKNSTSHSTRTGGFYNSIATDHDGDSRAGQRRRTKASHVVSEESNDDVAMFEHVDDICHAGKGSRH